MADEEFNQVENINDEEEDYLQSQEESQRTEAKEELPEDVHDNNDTGPTEEEIELRQKEERQAKKEKVKYLKLINFYYTNVFVSNV